MPAIPLALVSSLLFANAAVTEPDGDEANRAAWEEEEAEGPAEPEPLEAAPADAPAERPAGTAWPEPKRKGIGLLATAAAISGVSLGVTATRSILLRRNCPLDAAMTANKCTYDFGSDIGLAVTHWVLNFAAVGFAPAAGAVMGKHHAWQELNGKGKARKPGTFLGAGGALLGVGIVGIGTSSALSFVLSKRCVDKELESGDALAGDRCLLKAFPTWTLLNWTSFAMVGAGAGMLAYGSRYKKSLARHKMSFRVVPSFGRQYAGVGVAGQF